MNIVLHLACITKLSEGFSRGWMVQTTKNVLLIALIASVDTSLVVPVHLVDVFKTWLGGMYLVYEVVFSF